MEKLLERCTGRDPPHINIMNKEPTTKSDRNMSYGWCTFKTIFGTIHGYYIPEYEIILSFSERDLKKELKKRKLI